MTRNIGYIVGSLSSVSINRTLGRALENLAPEGVRLFEIPVKDLPFFSADFGDDHPQVVLDFKQAITDADGIIIITPEYNKFIPGVLKNALEWAARPADTNVFIDKPTAVAGAARNSGGAARAQQQLRQLLEILSAATMGDPTACIQLSPGLISETGEVNSDDLTESLREYLDAFIVHLKNFHSEHELVLTAP